MTKTKILAINGSPRVGNSELMLKEAVKGCEGLEVQFISLRLIKYGGCCGADGCFHNGGCHIHDDLGEALDILKQSDAIIIATPSYFNNVPGLLKDFMDRTNPYAKSKLLKGKKAVLLTVGGATLASVKKCEEVLRDFCKIHEIEIIDSVNAIAEKADDISKNKEKLNECREAGKKLKSYVTIS